MSGTPSIGKPSLDAILRVAQVWFERETLLSAPSKLNLRLKVEGRRSDGYHLLSMLNCSTSLKDSLRVALTERSDIVVEVRPIGALPAGQGENLVSKAFKAFWREFGLDSPPCGLRCEILKNIPIGGGLGGGSSDAGSVLRHLEGIFGEAMAATSGLSSDQVHQRVMRAALTCGADVPYAVVGGLCWVGGAGEEVAPIRVPQGSPSTALITIPPKPVSTVAFYDRFRALRPVVESKQDRLGRAFLSQGVTGDLLSLVENDFELTAIELVPEIGQALRLMREVFPAGTALTGSGSVCFSLVPGGMGEQASKLANSLSAQGFACHLCELIFS